jgi:hypothetical protein
VRVCVCVCARGWVGGWRTERKRGPLLGDEHAVKRRWAHHDLADLTASHRAKRVWYLEHLALLQVQRARM